MTSKLDSPPPYEDAVHHPKSGNYPYQPQHDSHLPPPPSYSPGFTPSGMPTTIPTLTLWFCVCGQVYLILTAQLAVTFSIVAVFTFVDPVRLFVIRYPGIYWASLYYETKAVFLAMGITALVCVAVTIFCFQTKVDFTSCGGLLSIAAVLLMIIGIVTAVVLSFQYVPWLHMLYAAIGAVVYTLFLVYNTQLLIGNRELAISPEEYIYGALSLYVDIVHIFLFILQVSGSATD
uniref:Transmembrane BAX inhibitor motif containing 1 n=1 Tax=Amphiprion percula TaxID=161767 RepID=A0A3P8SVK1_AMPPE